jgi:3-hydroxyisobutyrate dehydrogenase
MGGVERVGFVGLGHLGSRLAASVLRAGFPLAVHDLDPAAADGLLAEGAAWAGSPRETAERSDCVITCLPSAAALDRVVAGPEGVLAGWPSGGVWIDMGTNDRHDIVRLAALAAEHGITTLEAPVTGGVHRAAESGITVLVGGDEVAFGAYLGLFEAIGGAVFHTGPLGSASALKAITNMLAFVHLVAAGEALMLARRAGLDLAMSYEAIRASSGNSFVHETESRLILNGSYDVGFTMDLALKDLRLAHALGDEVGVPLELATHVEEIFARARAAYGGDVWSTMVVKLLEDELGTDLRAPGFPATLH